MTDAAVTLRVSGLPAPQGSKSAFIVWPKGGKPRAVLTDGKKGSPGRVKLDAWRAAVKAAADDQNPEPPLEGPVRLRAVFYLPRPKSYPRWRWLAWQKPDLDKLARSTMDGLTEGLVWTDDAQVVELAVRKVYAIDRPTGALLRIEPLAEEEQRLGHAWQLTGGRPPQLR